MFKRNSDTFFPPDDYSAASKAKKLKNANAKCTDNARPETIEEMVAKFKEKENNLNVNNERASTKEVILQAELDCMREELESYRQQNQYQQNHYSVSTISAEVLRMETGLPTKEIFNIVVEYALRFKDNICYYNDWTVSNISFEDQIFITLMKCKQNYTNLHLAQLFSCSISTIANIVITFAYVLHRVLFKDIMTSIPSRLKNSTCSPSSFSGFSSCKIVIDCTDIEIATPGLMSLQSATYSSYRGMNSFKVLVGVAPNAVITFISPLFPGSISDKEIVEKSGLLKHLETGDLVLADKGFLIENIVPKGVFVNIPPFLNNGKFTESEARATKSIAKCRIHVERANARLKDFKILSFVPSYLRCHVDVLFQLCAALVNLQFPLIKEVCEGINFD